VRDQVSHPYKTASKVVIVLYTFNIYDLRDEKGSEGNLNGTAAGIPQI
jgi:hypothetical protein